jgi:hypothetical protein
MARVILESEPRRTSSSRFRVTIYYTEPRYAASRGMPQREYSGSFEVDATNLRDAVSSAMAEFDRIAKLSSVGWTRRVTRVTCSRSGRDGAIEVFDDGGAYDQSASPGGSDRPTEPSGLFRRRSGPGRW